MTEQQQHEYQSHVRGAATWILLGKHEPMMDAAELVRLYNVPLAQALSDIDAIVQAEHAKSGGIFESRSLAQTLASQLSAAASTPMSNDRDELFELNGQTFGLVINQPKAKRQFRGYLTNHSTLELGSGRWDTIEQAEEALRAMAHKVAFGKSPPSDA